MEGEQSTGLPADDVWEGAVSHSFNLHLLLRGIIILTAAITDLLLPVLLKQEESHCSRPFWCCWKCLQ